MAGGATLVPWASRAIAPKPSIAAARPGPPGRCGIGELERRQWRLGDAVHGRLLTHGVGHQSSRPDLLSVCERLS